MARVEPVAVREGVGAGARAGARAARPRPGSEAGFKYGMVVPTVLALLVVVAFPLGFALVVVPPAWLRPRPVPMARGRPRRSLPLPAFPAVRAQAVETRFSTLRSALVPAQTAGLGALRTTFRRWPSPSGIFGGLVRQSNARNWFAISTAGVSTLSPGVVGEREPVSCTLSARTSRRPGLLVPSASAAASTSPAQPAGGTWSTSTWSGRS